jgi:hypothetical protein
MGPAMSPGPSCQGHGNHHAEIHMQGVPDSCQAGSTSGSPAWLRRATLTAFDMTLCIGLSMLSPLCPLPGLQERGEGEGERGAPIRA